MTSCRFCLKPIETGECCEDVPECNSRCRIRLGCGRKVANMERAKERYRYPKAQGGNGQNGRRAASE